MTIEPIMPVSCAQDFIPQFRCQDIEARYATGLFLKHKGKKHLVYRDDIIGNNSPIHITLFSLDVPIDIWNFNRNNNHPEYYPYEKHTAQTLGMKGEPVDICGGLDDGKDRAYSFEEFVQREGFSCAPVQVDHPLSPLVERLFAYNIYQGGNHQESMYAILGDLYRRIEKELKGNKR